MLKFVVLATVGVGAYCATAYATQTILKKVVKPSNCKEALLVDGLSMIAGVAVELKAMQIVVDILNAQ
jgi:hypothetical protein